MTRRRIWLLAAAIEDVRSASEWYERQSPGLGEAFVDALDASLHHVRDFPRSYPVDYRGARRCLMPRFPYCVYYRIDVDGVVVLACFHVSRDPDTVRRRL